MTETGFRHAFLVVLVVGISALFFAMVRSFVLTIVLAGLFSGVAYPAYRRVVRLSGGRARLSAVATLVVLLVLVVVPALVIAGAVANEALRLNETLLPRLQQVIDDPAEFDRRFRLVPGYELVRPYRTQILERAGVVIGGAGAFVFASLSATTLATAVFLFHFVVLVYTMFFFLTDGPALLAAVLAYLPLTTADKDRMLARFVSVTRATLKGTILIGAAQGALGGLAFWVAGIEGAIFWGTVMVVLSIIPGIGGALVWVPAALFLAASGAVWQAVGLALFCALIVGSVDNVLRPVLVGRDTRMHELLIFFSTIGGLLLFGAMGFILGPILAALFVAVWEMFGTAFRSELAEPAAASFPR